MDIKELLDQAVYLLNLTDNGWDREIYFDVSKLVEECGEVAACLNKTEKTDEDLAGELSDVMIVVAIIALKKDIDLDRALTSKHGKRVEKLLARFHSGKRTDPTKRISI
jgi:NTP pyrophosphatase (non-canonical NTP hydrolase)